MNAYSSFLKLVTNPSKKSQRMAPPQTLASALAQIATIDCLRGIDLFGIAQLSKADILLILHVAELLKAHKFDETQTAFAKGQTLAMLFEKPSLRTRVTFEAGMTQLGGHAIFLEGKLGVREAVADVGSNLDRWVDGIMARTFKHETLSELADHAKIPVINGLSDLEHPCQALADFQTIKEHKLPAGTDDFAGLKIAYVGDSNNVSNSLMLCAAKLGADFAIGCPQQFAPQPEVWSKAVKCAKQTGAQISISGDPFEAVQNADVVYTDTWVSMGQEAEAEVKEKIFVPYQVNKQLLQSAKPDAIVMHCLPAHRGLEITDDVLDGPQSVVLDQAENRLHAQKSVLTLVL